MTRLQRLSDNPVELGYWSFILSVTVQAFYHVERVAQVVQKYNLGWSSAPGFLGAATNEAGVHLIYAAASFASLLALWLVYFKNPGMWRKSAAGLFAVTFALVLQTFDLTLQTVRAALRTGGTTAPHGVAGHLFSGIELQFWISSTVLAALIVAYFAFKPSVVPSGAWDGSFA